MTQLARSASHAVRPVLTTAIALAAATASAQGSGSLAPPIRAAIDSAATEALAATGAQSASIAVVKDGAIAYVKAYGQARLAPTTPAATTMRYAIGSISKQFTAAALLILAEEGKLSLDDKVAKFFPEPTRADEITVRQILSHTAGIRDYWPQDYVFPAMREPITTCELMDRWARQPLDFEPGTKWQYSNTGFVIAGAIVEKVAGKPLVEFLRERIFTTLGMASVVDVDQGRLGPGDAVGYVRYGLGPPRAAPKEARGWLFAAGELAMTAEDLARWDVSLIEGRLLGAAGYRALTTEVLLSSGVGTGYGLGVDVKLESGRRVLAHGGAVSGFTAENRVYPDERAAIVVLTNQDSGNLPGTIADQIREILFVADSPADTQKLAQVREIFADLQRGTIKRSLLTANANDYFSATALADFKAGLGPLGTPKEFELKRQGVRGGFVTRAYLVKLAKTTLEVVTRATPEGKFEEYQVNVE